MDSDQGTSTPVRSGRRLRLGLRLFAFLLCPVLFAGCAAPALQPVEPVSAAAAAAPPPAANPARPWSEDVLYFVLVDRFADGDHSNNVAVDTTAKGTFHGGDLKGLVAHLDEIAGLGVTALWVNPLVKNIDGFVTGAGFPDHAYHGYWADDFTRLDPRFGTEEDLKALVAACHSRGIRVLLDVVYNHAGYGSRYLSDPKTKDWLRSEETGTCGTDDRTQCVAGLPDFKTEMPPVADYLLSVQLDWGKRSGVDGFRLDTVKHVDHPFWREHRARSRQILGDRFFLLGEVWGGDPQVLDPWFAGDEMDAGFDFGFQGSVVAFVQGRGRTVAFDRYLASRQKTRPGYLLAHFLSSHDVPGALSMLGGDVSLFRLAAILQFASAGIPMIYYGEEVARRGGDWPDNRSDMPWGARSIQPGAGQPRDEALRDDYRRLIAVRRSHPALSKGLHEGVSTDGDLYAFIRRDPASGDAVLVAINRGTEAATLDVAAPPEWADGPVTDVWNRSPITLSDGRVKAPVEPRGARILASSRKQDPPVRPAGGI